MGPLVQQAHKDLPDPQDQLEQLEPWVQPDLLGLLAAQEVREQLDRWDPLAPQVFNSIQ